MNRLPLYTTAKPAGVKEDRKPFVDSIKGNIPFRLDVSINITGEHVDKVIEKGVGCVVQSYAHELAVGDPIHLGNRELTNLEQGKYTYTLTLPEITINYGTIRFWVFAGLDNGPTIPNYVEVPTLCIE